MPIHCPGCKVNLRTVGRVSFTDIVKLQCPKCSYTIYQRPGERYVQPPLENDEEDAEWYQ